MLRTRIYVLLGVTLSIVGSIAFFCVGNAAYLERRNVGRRSTEQPTSAPPTTTPSTNNNRRVATEGHPYKEALARLEVERLRLASRFIRASSAERSALIGEARTVLTRAIYDDLFSAWYGTPWDFNGTSETPQQGKIACGYFVSTVLRDAGWKVERVRLAQQASENIILSLTTDKFVKRFRRVAIGDFVKAVKEWGTGIYIVGLDIHVGFIVNTGDEVYFVHSSYVEPYTVIKEKAIESRILAGSNYRVLGNVLADDAFITNWLSGKAISTKAVSANRGPSK
jgi:hypothetical protein